LRSEKILELYANKLAESDNIWHEIASKTVKGHNLQSAYVDVDVDGLTLGDFLAFNQELNKMVDPALPFKIHPEHFVFAGVHGGQEIMEMLSAINAESRPIWKPMHMQPIYRMNAFVTRQGNGRGRTNAYIDEGEIVDVGADIFQRGLCLPSDNKMTEEEQERIIEVVKRAFQ